MRRPGRHAPPAHPPAAPLAAAAAAPLLPSCRVGRPDWRLAWSRLASGCERAAVQASGTAESGRAASVGRAGAAREAAGTFDAVHGL